MAETYSAAEIIGKNLVAKKPVEIRRLPDINSPVVYTAQPGENIGVVFSYISAKNNNPLFWQFHDKYNRFYYVEHSPGKFSEKVVRDQGAITTKEQEEQKQEENKSTFEKISDTVKTFGAFFILAVLANNLTKK